MGTEKILFTVIIGLLLLSNIGFLITLAKKNKKLAEIKSRLKKIVIKNSNLFNRFGSTSIQDLAEMLDDKIVLYENETKQLRNEINVTQQKISKLESLNSIVSSHVNSLNKDVIKFISKLSECNCQNKDLESLCLEFKSALYKAKQFFEGLYTRTELLQALLNKSSQMKEEKLKNYSIVAVKSKTIKNRLSSIDKLIFKQSNELIDISDAAVKIQNEINNNIQNSFDKISKKLNLELNRRCDLRRQLNLNFDRNIKDLILIDNELDIVLENHKKESSSNRRDAIPMIVKDIKQKIYDMELDLQKVSSSNIEIFNQLVELDHSDSVMIYQLFKGAALFDFENSEAEIDHFDIKRIVTKSIQRNEYLLQMISDLIKESSLIEELSTDEWERLKEEAVILNDMKKNVSIMFNLLNTINIDSDADNELEIDLSNFSVSEDGEIII